MASIKQPEHVDPLDDQSPAAALKEYQAYDDGRGNLRPPPAQPFDLRDPNTAVELTPEVDSALFGMFVFQPWNEEQVERGRRVTLALLDAARALIKYVPPGPDRSTALRKLREARMDANSAITHNGRY